LKAWWPASGAAPFERIAAVLDQDEDRTDLVREAVEREITRREATNAKAVKD